MTHNIGPKPLPKTPSSRTQRSGAISGSPWISATGAQRIAELPSHQSVVQRKRPGFFEEMKRRLEGGESPTGAMLREAVERGSLRSIKYLIVDKRIHPNNIFKSPRFSLREIIKSLDILVKNGLDLSDRNENDKTLLEDAFEKRDIDAIEALAAKGANFNQKDSTGKTAVHHALDARDVELVQKLIRLRIKIPISFTKDPLMAMLIKNDGDIHKQDSNGFTMLQHACATGDVAIVRQLIAQGAKIGVGNHYHEIPYLLAFSPEIPPEKQRAVLRALSEGEGEYGRKWLAIGHATNLARWDVLADAFAENWFSCQDWMFLCTSRVPFELLGHLDDHFVKAGKNNEIMANCIVALTAIVGKTWDRERAGLRTEVLKIFAEWRKLLPEDASPGVFKLLYAAQHRLRNEEKQQRLANKEGQELPRDDIFDARAYFKQLGLI